jgi:hypothetical protein
MTGIPPKQAWTLACLLTVTGSLLIFSVLVVIWLATFRE